MGEKASVKLSKPFLYTEKAIVYVATVLNCSALLDSKEKKKTTKWLLCKLCLRYITPYLLVFHFTNKFQQFLSITVEFALSNCKESKETYLLTAASQDINSDLTMLTLCLQTNRSSSL